MSSIALPITVSSGTNETARLDLGYRRWLDGLRGIAICLVFVHHLQHFIYEGGPLFGWLLLPFGLLGVDIFFVLSGFLITTLLLEEHQKTGNISLTNFYIRRALRLLPALIFLLVCMVVYSRLFLPAHEADWTARLSVIALLYSTNWVFALWGLSSDLLGHLWSLAIEEQFYLIWPLALSLLLRSRLSRTAIPLIILALIVVICIHRTLLVSPEVIPMRIYAGSDTRADSLLVGCLVALLVSWRLLPSTRITPAALKGVGILSVLVIAAYILDLFGITGRTIYKTGFTVFAGAVGAFILRVMTADNRYISLLEAPALVWIGKLSYSLYLWHFFTIGITLQFPVSNAMRVALSIPIAFAISAFSFYLIEQPFLKLKSRYASTPTPSMHATPSTPLGHSPDQTTASFV